MDKIMQPQNEGEINDFMGRLRYKNVDGFIY